MRTIYMQALAIVMLVSCLSCENNDDNAPAEAVKNIDGSWKVVNVTRNDLDITGAFDFTRFRVNFSEDGTYSFENYLPFIVKEEGDWALDDPQYPFKIIFREGSSAETLAADLTYPVVQGNRQIQLTFSPGCQLNRYKYVLERINE
ncbi:DUF5004 domain-containing protein [Parachryseolinea silvisoli]|jgi:hypothetical protein|uniref:DUF5004 domain-containing protein n=1 Tax=Parachryseolinea silvisoli TaxID=2873601 RepID=UPI002265EFFE|nr:DUF5004 domain-containing protein [Parachryseolinea silvisoli]MCD9014830.1 DUF5004 domain-containing protein [Parachryseolinea silvisoli]